MIGRMIIAGALVFLVACVQEDERDEPPVDFAPAATPDTIGGVGRTLEDAGGQARFERPAPDTGAIGTARLLESGPGEGTRTVAIEVSGLPAGSYTWQLRRASCGSEAAAETAASGTLEVGAAGFGEASALLPVADVAGYSAVIRSGAGAIIACAAF